MSRKQGLANKAHYESLAIASGGFETPQAQIEWNDIHWTALTAEPGGVDYREVATGKHPAIWIEPHGADKDRVIFYAHGGGFVSGSIYTHRKMVAHLAKRAGCRALLFEYEYAHVAKYPAQLNSAMAAYRWLVSQGVSPEHIAMAGDSAGAILTFGVLQKLRDEGQPLPAAVLILSGWVDLAVTSPSYDENREKDVFFSKAGVEWLVANVLGQSGDRKHPLVSPLYADLRGMPPMFLQYGSDEALVGEGRALADKAKAAGVDVRLDVFPGMLHTFHMMAGRAPEADDGIARFAAWLRPRFGLKPGAPNRSEAT